MGVLRALTIAFLALWGLGVLAVPAAAHDPLANTTDPYRYTPYDPTAPNPVFFAFDWSGFYVGAHLGWGYTSVDSDASFVDPFDPLFVDVVDFDQSASSVVGGVQAGWQKQWGRFVGGFEITYTALDFDERSQSPIAPDISRSAEVSDLITLTGRLGYADGRWLAYAKGGWASAEVDINVNLAGVQIASSSGRESGWTAGVGIDYALMPNLFLGVEYNIAHFGIDAPSPLPLGAQFGDIDVDIQTVTARLNYRFGVAHGQMR